MAESDQATGVEQSLNEGATQLKEHATQLKEQAAHLAEQQKETGARQLSGIAGAVHAAADQLDQQLPGAARCGCRRSPRSGRCRPRRCGRRTGGWNPATPSASWSLPSTNL